MKGGRLSRESACLLSFLCVFLWTAFTESIHAQIQIQEEAALNTAMASDAGTFRSDRTPSSQTEDPSNMALRPLSEWPPQESGSPPFGEESNVDFSAVGIPQEDSKEEQGFDIPIVINTKVEQFIAYFQTEKREKFTEWLSRSTRYIPLMKNILREQGLPQDLAYLTLIESGLNPHALSRSKACGLWQFIAPTGKRYGLKVNGWVDERRDPEKSTTAAARYLKDLHDMFECWFLATAGYNAGEFKIVKAMRRYRTEDFWELSKHRYLKTETKNYVPQMIAAALIAKDPEKYGFTGLEFQDPFCFEKVSVPPMTGLDLIAKACETGLEDMKDLNPELLRGCTPPDVDEYEVRIPCGRRETFPARFEALRPTQRFRFKTHIIKKGDTLSAIARSYRVDLAPLLEINRIKKTKLLSIGTPLLIPIPMRSSEQSPVTIKQEWNGKNKGKLSKTSPQAHGASASNS